MRHALLGRGLRQDQVWRSLAPHAERLDSLGRVLAVVLLALSSAAAIMEQSRIDEEARPATTAAAPTPRAGAAMKGASTLIAAYGGVPYTYPSDVVIQRPGVHDLTVKDVAWDARPFKSPIYYGVRVARFPADAVFGGMLDFTHSKAISRFQDTVALQGTLFGEKAPEQTRVGELFRHLEFSHGHNMLTLNGIYRLPRIAARIVPYVGLGAGGSFPHTEIAFNRENVRTYEYQYTGPVGQALAGVEVRVGRQTYFLEYKFTLAAYAAPLTQQDGWLGVTDVWRQLRRWMAGEAPPGGYARTRLTSHQVIGGLGIRVGGTPAVSGQ